MIFKKYFVEKLGIKIKNNVIMYSISIYLFSVPPVILDNSTQSVQTTSGQSVYLSCYADGFPKPKITWRRENNDILPTGGAVYKGNILAIHNINKQDRGTYYCIADNGVGKGAQRHVGVEVECKYINVIVIFVYQYKMFQLI